MSQDSCMSLHRRLQGHELTGRRHGGHQGFEHSSNTFWEDSSHIVLHLSTI